MLWCVCVCVCVCIAVCVCVLRCVCVKTERNLERFADSSKADSVKLPPVVDLNQLYPLLTAYGDRIVEYQQICFKLLLLETWEDVSSSLSFDQCGWSGRSGRWRGHVWGWGNVVHFFENIFYDLLNICYDLIVK